MDVPWAGHLQRAANRPASDPRRPPSDHLPSDEADDLDQADDFDAGPPRTVLATAQEILGKHITARQVAGAWDTAVKQLRDGGRKVGLVPQDEKIQLALGALLESPAEPAAGSGLFRGETPPAPEGANRSPSPPPAMVTNRPKRKKPQVHYMEIDDDEPPAPPPSRKRQVEPDLEEGPSTGSKGKRRKLEQPIVILSDDEPIMLAGPSNAAAPPAAAPSPPRLHGSDATLVRVIDVVPDVLPSHVLELFDTAFSHLPETERTDAIVDRLLNDANYPKAPRTESKGKGKAKEEPVETDAVAVGKTKWLAKDRAPYADLTWRSRALEILNNEFCTVPKGFVRTVTRVQKDLLIPSWFAMQEELAKTPLNFVPLKHPRPRGFDERDSLPAGDIRDEWAWLNLKHKAEKDAALAQAEETALEEAERLAGSLLECGCCFGDFRFIKMIQCAEGHLFCQDCARQNAETAVGDRKAVVQCMDGSGCKEVFPNAELARVLEPKTMDLLEKIRTEKSIDTAEIEGLQSCPWCPFAMIIENPDERLFKCRNEECEKVSCRRCRRINHIPKTCKEVEDDEKGNNVHRVEEAMTAALIRHCPKCKNPFVKESGCNKMFCSNCRTLSCFVCGKAVSGYEHFLNAGINLLGKKQDPNATCPLWDDSGKRTHEEVERARAEAAAAMRADGVELDAATLERLRADAPPPADPLLNPYGRGPGPGPGARLHAAADRIRHAQRVPPPVPRFDRFDNVPVRMGFGPPAMPAPIPQGYVDDAARIERDRMRRRR